jgi:DNA-binding response OmpR family regulator
MLRIMEVRSLAVLCVVDRRNNRLTRTLRGRGHAVVEAYTGDQGVALCVGDHFDAVILDQELFIETEGWSLAQSFKMVRPTICVLLVSRARRLETRKPNGVDAIASVQDIPGIVATLERLV